MAGLGAVTVGAVAAGAFVITRDSGDEVVSDDAVEIVQDSNTETPQNTANYNFAAATASVQQAASITFDMDIQTPEGPMIAVASFDRASGRMEFDIDISQFVLDDEFFDMGDSFQIIVDEPNDVTYMSASVMGALFGEPDAAWISTDSGDFSSDDDLFGQLFNNPLGIADVFGDTEPIDLGDEIIDGETLRRYEVMFADDVTDDTTYDVWVSEDSQIRRIMFEVEDDSGLGTVDLRISVSPEAIDIALPDPSDVLDIDAMFDEAFSETTTIDVEGGDGTVTVDSDGDSTNISISVDGDPIEFSTDDVLDETTQDVVDD